MEATHVNGFFVALAIFWAALLFYMYISSMKWKFENRIHNIEREVKYLQEDNKSLLKELKSFRYHKEKNKF